MKNLAGKKALIVGIANESSIAYGCAKALNDLGVELCITYSKDKTRQYVEPLLNSLNAPMFLPMNVIDEKSCKEVFARIEQQWGNIDILLHSVAFAPQKDLYSRVIDCTKEGFLEAMDISCHSFIRLANYAQKL
jgi:enoyl-[acyl-carrier protein] reductase I